MSSRHYDFVIDDTIFERVVMRIYPNGTYIHSFDEIPPKEWSEVYKVYYDWAIIRTPKDSDGNLISEEGVKIFDMPCDECSIIPSLGELLENMINDKNKTENQFVSFGMPASLWEVSVNEKNYRFSVWDNFYNNGYRFWLNKTDALRFIDWLKETNDKLLKICGREI